MSINLKLENSLSSLIDQAHLEVVKNLPIHIISKFLVYFDSHLYEL